MAGAIKFELNLVAYRSLDAIRREGEAAIAYFDNVCAVRDRLERAHERRRVGV